MNPPDTAIQPPMQPSGPLAAYAAQVEAGILQEDAAQAQAAACLQMLHDRLGEGERKWLIFKADPLPGLYIWGNVGRGKSLLMNIFFSTAPVELKRRVHFHAFMQEVHARLHNIRQTTAYKRGSGDPVAILIQQLVREVRLLCFDELQATDVADAGLIFRLFEGLLAAGVVIVSTSNHPPESLYTGGVQRERFDKLISLIREKMDVFALSSPHDYRHMQAKALKRSYFWPLGVDAKRFIQETLATLAPGAKPTLLTIPVQGRELHLTVYDGEVGLASFQELCATALGPADYLAIAEKLDALIMTEVPILTPEKRNEAKRFVTLIDALYERKVTVFITAEAAPEQLYPEGEGSFEFQRTVSRLAEMQSAAYLAA